MQTKLQKYFPMLRSREEILREIDENVKLTEQFYSWREAQRQEFWIFAQECVESKCCMILFLKKS